MAPQKIMFIRHAEKPEHQGVALGINENGNEDKESLIVLGWQRAGALIHFFSYETIAPLSAFLKLPIDKSCAKDEIEKLVEKATVLDGVVLVSWEHRKIPLIGRILVAGSQTIPDWPDDRFDMVWIFDHVDGGWKFSQVPQLLLHGDRPEIFI